MDTLGKRIAHARTRKGWSQNDLEKKAALSLGMVSRAEKDERAPTTRTLSKLASALDVHVEWLISGTPPMELEEPSQDDQVPNRAVAARLARDDGVHQAAIQSVVGEKSDALALTRSVLWWTDRMRMRQVEIMGTSRARPEPPATEEARPQSQKK